MDAGEVKGTADADKDKNDVGRDHPDRADMKASATDPASVDALRTELRALSAEVCDLRAQVTVLCELERFRDVILDRYVSHAAVFPSRRRLDARDFVDGVDGFHQLEYDSGGIAYRWTGPGHFTRVRFHVDRSVPVKILLTLASLGRHTEQNRITVDVDGTVYPMRRIGGEGVVLAAGPVAPRTDVTPTDLFFHVPATFSPATSGNINDVRVIGVAVTRIEVLPAS